MTTRSLRRLAVMPLAALLGFAAVTTPALNATSPVADLQSDKSIYLTALDANGNAVTDLTLGEVALREDNKDREIVSVKRATQPLAIVLLADTSKEAGTTGLMSRQDTVSGSAELIRDIRSALTGFAKGVNAASPESTMELMEFGQAAMTVSRMTSNMADVEKGIGKLFPKPGAASVLLEAIVEASKTLAKAPTPRRAIVVLNIEPGDEQSRQEPKKMNDELLRSGAALWAVSLQKGQGKNEMRGVVLEGLTKNTGGRRESIVGQSALETIMKTFADNLTSQYEVTYRRPAGESARVVQVGVMRTGLKLYASIFAPK
jgi:hypothetical protein